MRRSKYLTGAAFLLALGGVFVTWVLSFTHTLAYSLPCGESGGCDAIATSAASRIFGYPVAYLGLGAYLALAFLSAHRLKTGSGRLWMTGYAISLVGSAVSLGFTLYSIRVLRNECAWCVASNIIMCLSLLVYSVESRWRESMPAAWKRDRWWVLLSCLACVAGAAYQSVSILELGKRLAYDPLALARLDPKDLTPPDALTYAPSGYSKTVVAFVDLQCGMCQKVVPELYDLAQRDHFRLVIRHCPLPLHPDSFRLAVLAVQATQFGKGWAFLLRSCKGGYDTTLEFSELLEELNLSDAYLRGHEAEAVKIVQRDQLLSQKLRLGRTPTLILMDQRVAVISVPELEHMFQ